MVVVVLSMARHGRRSGRLVREGVEMDGTVDQVVRRRCILYCRECVVWSDERPCLFMHLYTIIYRSVL